MHYKFVRFFDVIISVVVLIVLFPLFIIISILILMFDGRPVIFKQNRIGYCGKKFKILKFRTMKNNFLKMKN